MTQMVGARTRFLQEFSRQLRDLHTLRPTKYRWPLVELPAVVLRMNVALDTNAFEKDAPAVKATCKALGIKNTYGDIALFIHSDKLYELKGE